MNLQKTKMQCKLRCGTQVRRSEKLFVFFLFFVQFLKMWSRGWRWGRCPLTNVADWKRGRGREALFWTSKWCTTRPRQNNRPANPIKPKTKKYIWRLAGNKSPSRNNNSKNWKHCGWKFEKQNGSVCVCVCVTIHLFLNYWQWDSSLIPPFIIDHFFVKAP